MTKIPRLLEQGFACSGSDLIPHYDSYLPSFYRHGKTSFAAGKESTSNEAEDEKGEAVSETAEDTVLKSMGLDLARWERHIGRARQADDENRFTMAKNQISRIANDTEDQLTSKVNPSLKRLFTHIQDLHQSIQNAKTATRNEAMDGINHEAGTLARYLQNIGKTIESTKKIVFNVSQANSTSSTRFLDPKESSQFLDDGTENPKIAERKQFGKTSIQNNTGISEACKCEGPCGAHQGAEFSWCVVDSSCQSIKLQQDPTLRDHRLWEQKNGEQRPIAERYWDYCSVPERQAKNVDAPLTANSGCHCAANEFLLDQYDPTQKPYYRKDGGGGKPMLDLDKVPFRDRMGVQIMTNRKHPEWLEKDQQFPTPVGLCVTPKVGRWSYCPTDPSCKRKRDSDTSIWHRNNSWDFCMEPGWGGVPRVTEAAAPAETK